MKLTDILFVFFFIIVGIFCVEDIEDAISLDPKELVELIENNSSDIIVRIFKQNDKPLETGVNSTVTITIIVENEVQSWEKCARESSDGEKNSSGLIGDVCRTNSDCPRSSSWCRPSTCQCDSDHYASGDGTQCISFERDLHEPCLTDAVCKTSFSTCINGKCQCQENYLEHKKTCYGLPSAMCNRPTDCVSRDFSCVSGTCQDVTHYHNEKEYSSKPGFSSYWKSRQSAFWGLLSSVYIGSQADGYYYLTRNSPIYSTEEILKGSVGWCSSCSLDRVIRDTAHNPMGIYCRVHYQQYVYSGAIEPPHYRTCDAWIDGSTLSFSNYEVLVE